MLSLEITESLLLTDHLKVLSQLTQLRAIVESIIAMARRLGIKLIAEGVETEGQAALLAAAHCDFVQGYLYARPMLEREFFDFVHAVETTALAVPALLAHVD